MRSCWIASRTWQTASTLLFLLATTFASTPAIAQVSGVAQGRVAPRHTIPSGHLNEGVNRLPKDVGDSIDSQMDQNIGSVDVKMAIYDMVRIIERVANYDTKASDEIFHSQPEIWNGVKNKAQVISVAQDFRKFRETGIGTRSPRLATNQQSMTLSPQVGTAAFIPNYPEVDVNYSILSLFNLVTSTTKRVNTDNFANFPKPDNTNWPISNWTTYETVVKSVQKELEVFSLACEAAGCDPTGIVCISVCGPVKVFQAAAAILMVPIDCADAWDAKIDSAEIEAAYQNAVIGINNLNAHDAKLSTHNSNLNAHIANLRAEHAAMTAKLNATAGAAQEMNRILLEKLAKIEETQALIIKLLLTPEGRRPGWGKAGF